MSSDSIYWLLTWTTYGTWLPGDQRGFVSNVRGPAGTAVRHNIPGTDYHRDLIGLNQFARAQLTGEPILLTADQAAAVADDIQSSATFRSWDLQALAIMRNHVHLVVGAGTEIRSDRLLQVFKSYASRKLNTIYPRPRSQTWWTTSGSRRRLPDNQAVEAATAYVLKQEYPLIVWPAILPE